MYQYALPDFFENSVLFSFRPISLETYYSPLFCVRRGGQGGHGAPVGDFLGRVIVQTMGLAGWGMGILRTANFR